MISNRLFRSSAFALLALIARGSAWGQQPASPGQPPSPDLPPLKMQYDKDAKTGYSVTGTDNILRVRLWVADPQQQRKIMSNGLELWLDTKGKKNKATGIIYPLPSPAGASAKVGPSQNQANITPPEQGPPAAGDRRPEKPSLQSQIALQKEMKLVGFNEELNGVQNQHHPSGIDVSLRVVNDTLYYEAQIPLNMLAAIPAGQRISIGVIEKGRDPSEFTGGMPGDGGGPPPGGGDGMGPGGSPPGDMPGGMDIEQFANNTIWYKFVYTGNK